MDLAIKWLFKTADFLWIDKEGTMACPAHGGEARRCGLVLVIGLLLSGCVPAQVGAGPVYLALGDSITFGVGADDSASDVSNGDRGYVGLYADYLGQAAGTRPSVINLAVSGETSASFLGNGVGLNGADASARNTNYGGSPRPSQFDLLIATLANQQALGNTISTVTISLGANDLFQTLAVGGSFPEALAAYQANETRILSTIRAALPSTNLILLGYFDPYAPFVNDPTSPLYPIALASAQAIPLINSIIAAEAQAFGAQYVDLFPVFQGKELSATYIQSGNVHPKPAGYQLIAAAIEAVPEPASILLVGVGVGLLPVVSRINRQRSLKA